MDNLEYLPTNIEWWEYEKKKPRAGLWVLVLSKNGKCFLACRNKESDVMWFAKGRSVLEPLFWAKLPTIIKLK